MNRPLFTKTLLARRIMLLAPLTVAGCIVDTDGLDFPEPIAETQAPLLSQTVDLVLNTDITDEEHCRLPSSMITTLGGTGRQVRIQKDTHFGLCTVEATASASSDIEMNADGISDHFGTTASTVTGVTVSTINNSSGQEGVVKLASDITTVTSINGFSQDAYEYEFHPTGAQVVYTAPHGRIETSTDDQVEHIYDDTTAGRDAFWIASYNTDASDDHGHLHITSKDISGDSFPKLGELLNSSFKYAVSFHGFDNTAYSDVLVGGDESYYFRKGVAEIITDYLKAVSSGSTPTVAYSWSGSDYKGTDNNNFVNRLADSGRGLQIEQSKKIRVSGTTGYDPDYKDAVAEGVKSVYDCLLDTPDFSATVSSKPYYKSVGTGYTAGACPRWIGQITIPSNIGTVTFEPTTSSCYGGTGHVDVYKQNTDGTWSRLGGGWHTYPNYGDDVCVLSGYKNANYTTPISSTPGVFRVVVRATSTSNTPTGVYLKVL